MTAHEDLSRLLTGELSPEEESRLLDRIASEPDLALAWETLQLLPEDLARLPALDVPPDLDALVLKRYPRAPRTISMWPLLVAAALLLVALFPHPKPTLTLLDGSQVVEGNALVHASGVDVAVDGRAKISVEPGGRPARVMALEDPDMKSAIAGAALGALVTVSVFEGKAHLTGPDGKEVVVNEGETQSLHGSVSAAPAPVNKPAFADRGKTEAELLARVDELEGELEKVKFEQALQKGQLAQHEGSAQEFPKDLPDAFRPDAMKAAMQRVVAQIPGATMVDLDCSEYPCIAILQESADAETWGKTLKAEMTNQFGEEGKDGKEEPDLSIWMSNIKDGDKALSVAAVAVYPPAGEAGANASDGTSPETRANFRAEGLMKDAAAEGLGK